MSSPQNQTQPGPIGPRKPKARKSPYLIPITTVFYLCLISNFIAAYTFPIQDCDEVFNYWEPVHYLLYGHGLQTWEYSPSYAIRSWLYTAFHAIFGKLGSPLVSKFMTTHVPNPSKTTTFYVIRYVLAIMCSVCQLRLYAAVSRNLNQRIGVFLIVVMLFSAGMFHASISMLPSSFAMFTGMLGTAGLLDGQTVRSIVWFAIGTIMGWPFAGALALPFLSWKVLDVLTITGPVKVRTAIDISKAALYSFVFLAFESLVDSLFYRKLSIVPWNIIFYNVFSPGTGGPELYGVEPWTFYFSNLALNFNLFFVFALLSFPLAVFQALARQSPEGHLQSFLRLMLLISPFYIWLAIFSLQPHKEERFMYPAYPFLALNAGISLYVIASSTTSTGAASSTHKASESPRAPSRTSRVSPRRRMISGLIDAIPLKIRAAFVLLSLLVSANFNLLRVYGIIKAYDAPLKILSPLENETITTSVRQPLSVCYGKEWYRFPSSFFLPHTMKAKFVQSEFRGLLPGEFAEKQDFFTEYWPWPGTWVVPSGMNDMNLEDPAKHHDISQCTYLVDSYFSGRKATPREPQYLLEDENWESLLCLPFLDAARTRTLGRVFWFPQLPNIMPESTRKYWGTYCLLKNKNHNATTSEGV